MTIISKRSLFPFFLTYTALFLSMVTVNAKGRHRSKYAQYPFYATSRVDNIKASPHMFQNNQVQLLHSGIAALQKRIDLIRKAKHRISAEYFIWEHDKAGLLMWHELIKRAKEGIDVRVTLDKSITVLKMDNFYAEALAKYGVKVRYYHRSLDPSSAQFRNHRKILVIDGSEAITGGRNIGDDYFDLDEEYNFLDRDIYVQGKVAQAIEDSFDIFWNDKLVMKFQTLNTNPASNRLFRKRRNGSHYQNIRQEAFDRRRKEAQRWIDSHAKMEKVGQNIEEIARPIINTYPIEVCPNMLFVSDRPGANFLERIKQHYRDEYKNLRKALLDHIQHDSKPSETMYLASPYFIPNDFWRDSLSYALKKGVKIDLMTNSLGSTDAFYVAAAFYDKIYNWQEVGFSAYLHNSKYNPYYSVLNEEVREARWGMHDKSHIYNDKSFFIGTFNIDNRSDFYNAEMGIFCSGSKSLTDNLKVDMKERINKSYLITGKGKAIDSDGHNADIYGHASKKMITLMKAFKIPSRLFKPLL